MWRFDSTATDAGVKRFRRRMVLSSILVLLVMFGLIGRDLAGLWQVEAGEENRALSLVAEALRAQMDAAVTIAARTEVEMAAAIGDSEAARDHPPPADRARLASFLKSVAPDRSDWSLYDAAGHLIADSAAVPAPDRIDLGGSPWLKGEALGRPIWLAPSEDPQDREAGDFALAMLGPPLAASAGSIIVSHIRLRPPASLVEAARQNDIEISLTGPSGERPLLEDGKLLKKGATPDRIRMASEILPIDYVASRDHGGMVKMLVLRHIGLLLLGMLVAALVLFHASLALHQAQRIEEQGEALRQSIEATIRESQAKTTLLANMSHELRTPLNAIIGFSDLMREQMFGPIGSERYRGYVADIADAGRHMLGLVEDLLNYTSMGAQIRKLSPAWLDICDLLAACAQMVQPEARQAGVELIVAAPNDLPRILADERAMRQILLNLLSNAIKFTPQGGSVTLACTRESDGLLIEIIDTGIGIKPEDLGRIFDPFVQSSPAVSRSRSGIGLGLAIVKGLTEASGFSISIASEPGIGTTFRIAVPRDKTRPRNPVK